ncbi:MAG: hypothetical protein V4819_14825 [Verrucomicrobiota bacterium]
MKPLLTIDPRPASSPARDFATLRETGLEEIRRTAGETWTDHNLHDPGITLLELLCYGITDAAYRTTFADADLFARCDFPTARAALTCEPVTANDYRRLILDAFPTEIRNVWVEPATRALYADPATRQLLFKPADRTLAFEIHGFHRIRLQLHQHVGNAARTALIAAVTRLYHAHRNLGEDLHSVAVTDTLPIRVCADIQLAPAADIEKAHAAIIHAIQNFLNPAIPRHPLANLTGRLAEEIFSGPPMVNGFILEEDLDRTTSVSVVRSSDLIAEILRIPEVIAIPRILLNPVGSPEASEHWELPVAAELEPSLAFADARLHFYKDLIPFQPDLAESLAELEILRADELRRNDFPDAEDFPVPAGTWSDPAEFTTLQESLPATYGCGSRGLNRDRSPAAVSKARQLQAFLLVFDQILANDLSQLANLHRLFSSDPDLTQTLFPGTVSSVPALAFLLKKPYAQLVASALAEPTAEPIRRSAILDHLLARFGERFADDVLMNFGPAGLRTVPAVIHAKATFLAELPQLDARRARGHDLRDIGGIWDTENVSGFKHRLERLLGFPTFTRRSVWDITYDFYEEKDADSVSEIRFRIVDRKTKPPRTLLSGTTRYPNKDAAEAEMLRAIELGMEPSNFDVKQAVDGKWFVTIVDRTVQPENIVAMRKKFFRTREQAVTVRDLLVDIFADRFSEEGCFVVEHLSMWPRSDAWPLLAAPLEATPESPASWDPYSFHLHIVLPGWGARLGDPGFRAFVEQTIRRELPAHLIARICFIGREPMREFEENYRAWLTALATDAADSPAVLGRFIECLENLHTIYPTGTLHDCKEDGDERNPVVLGRTHLGTQAPP